MNITITATSLKLPHLLRNLSNAFGGTNVIFSEANESNNFAKIIFNTSIHNALDLASRCPARVCNYDWKNSKMDIYIDEIDFSDRMNNIFESRILHEDAGGLQGFGYTN